ncbi:MAG: tyrosine-type recombinase/integrase, partial [Pseudomonadota bacterium]|nr:tyrosine-type recombinase/integrase [Pseudomonadota bacterium]
MAIKKHSTKYAGVRYYEHATRMHGRQPDRYFTIRYQKDGKRVEEGLGWASGHVDVKGADRKEHNVVTELQDLGGMTATRASTILMALKNEAKKGGDTVRIKDLREKKRECNDRKEIEAAEKNAAAVSFSKFFNEYYFPEERRIEKPSQYVREESLFRIWIEPVIGDLALQEITDDHINRIKTAMQQKGRSARSILYMIAVIRQVFNKAKKKKISHGKGRFFEGATPVVDVEKPKLKNERTAFFTKDQASDLLDALKVKSELSHNIALVSLDTGLRASEVFKLEWEDINLDFNFVHVKDPKNGCPRNVPMTKRLIELFSSWMPGRPTENVFSTRDQ